MSLPLYWTDEAKDTFDAIVLFIGDIWGEKEAQKFIKRTQEVLSAIADQPYLFKASLTVNIRKGLISKQSSVFYEIHPTQINILWFWDNRQDPIF